MDLWRKGLYAIADAGVLAQRGMELRAFALGLRAAGVQTVQLRDKSGRPEQVLARAAVLWQVFAGTETLLIMNDRVDLGLLAGFGGVHLGQSDVAPGDVRRLLDRTSFRHDGALTSDAPRTGFDPGRFLVGMSTHSEDEVRVFGAVSQGREMVPSHFFPSNSDVDYVAVGPVFSTSTKLDAEPVVGLEGVGRARALTALPLVAIGGITRDNARSVIDAGADSVAVVSGLLVPGESVESVARDFLRILR
jgi:thiamine-phosphate pyrophosphorylase